MNKTTLISKKNRMQYITYAFVIVAYIVLQLLSGKVLSSTVRGMLVPICAYVVMAISLNLTVGVMGELSLGHAGFMSVGAFMGVTAAVALQNSIASAPLRLAIAMLVGAFFAAIAGFLIGIPVMRLKGDYLAIVTLAFGEIIKTVINAVYMGKDSKGFHFSLENVMALNLEADGQVIIKGAQGISGTPKNSTFTIGVILLLVTLVIVLNLIYSRGGRAIMAIRDNRIAAESVGINITKYKIMAFSISAALAGLAGVLYSHNLSTLTATSKNFGYNQSIMILVFVVLGGMGNIRGSVISAVILTLLPELLRGLQDYRMLIYSIVLIAMMIFNWSPKIKVWRESHPFFKKKNQKEEA